VAANGDIDFHARRHVVTQHLDHAPDRRGALARLLDDFHRNDLAVAGTAGLALGNGDVIGNALVVRGDEVHAALAVVAPHHVPGVALEHLDHVPLAAPATVHTGNPNQHPVAMEQGMHLPRRQVDIVPALVRDQEAEAVLMADDTPGNQVELVRQGVAVAAVAHQLAVTHHGIEAPAQGLDALLVADAQQLLHILAPHRPVGLGDDIQDVFAAGDRLFVAFRFAARMGIAHARLSGAGFLPCFHSEWVDQLRVVSLRAAQVN